jgi:hypothetical protein
MAWWTHTRYLSHPKLNQQENTTTVAAGMPTVESAQYCDELPAGGATQGMAGGAGAGNQTTQGMAGNQTTEGMAGGAMPGDATTTTPGMAPPSNATTTAPAPAGNATTGGATPTNATSTSGANTTTTVTPPEAGGTGRKGSKKLNLRHW